MSAPKKDAFDSDDRVVEVEHLKTVIGGQTVHEDVSLHVCRGEIVGLVGASGSGKSVLMRTLIGLNKPEAGHVRIFGQDVYAISERERQSLSLGWGVVFQENALFSTLTVAENIMLVIQEQFALPEQLARELAAVKINLAGLPPDAASLLPSELSGGMRKRAAVARAIAIDPQLLLFDEPTTGLDPVVASKLDQLVLTLRSTMHPGILIVTHDLDTLFTICDRVMVLADHKIVANGPPFDVAKDKHPWIAQYFQGERGKAAMQSAIGAKGKTRELVASRAP